MRITRTFLLALALMALTASSALATTGTHFDSRNTYGTFDAGSLTVTFRVAGLGNDAPQVAVWVTGTAACVNGGDHVPKAANKSAVGGGGDFAVVNGVSTGSFLVTGTPHCGGGQTLVYQDITIWVNDAGLQDTSTANASLRLGNFS